jgi:Zn-dependent protease
MFSTALALSANLMLALFGLVALLVLHALSPSFAQPGSLNAYLLGQVVLINLALVSLNAILPIPPLDCARVLRQGLGARSRSAMDAFEPFGIFAVMLLLALLFVGDVLDPVFEGVQGAFGAVFDEPYAEALVKNLRGRA